LHHHLPSTPGNVHWGLWDGTLKPVLKIKSGDTVTIDTLSGEPEDMPDPALGFSVVPGHKEVHETTFRGPGPHFLTGPIYIEDAEPGDVLQVRLLDIKNRADWGWNIQVPFLGTIPMSRVIQSSPDFGLTDRLSWSEVVHYNPGHCLG
jgi:acetamidase/formamidase